MTTPWRVFELKLGERRRILSTSFRKIGNRVRLDRTLPFVSYRCSARKVAEEILAIELREAAITRLRCQSGIAFRLRSGRHSEDERHSAHHGREAPLPTAVARHIVVPPVLGRFAAYTTFMEGHLCCSRQVNRPIRY